MAAAAEATADTPLPEQEAEAAELSNHLRVALTRLPARQAEAFEEAEERYRAALRILEAIRDELKPTTAPTNPFETSHVARLNPRAHHW